MSDVLKTQVLSFLALAQASFNLNLRTVYLSEEFGVIVSFPGLFSRVRKQTQLQNTCYAETIS